MSETRERVMEIDPLGARRRNRKHMMFIGGLAVIAAAIVASLFLIPSPDIIDGQIQRETAPNVTVETTPSKTGAGQAQVLAGPHGSTFIIGNPQTLVGTNVSLTQLVNARDPAGFPGTILIRSAEVQTVPGDQVFSIGETPANSILVKIDEPTQPGNLSESALVVRPGQRVAVSGTVTKVGSLDELKRVLGVSSFEAGRLGNTALIIRANTVQLLQ
jgi:hypothetical protein